MTRLKKSRIRSILASIRPKSKIERDLEKLSKDSYELALAKLKTTLAEAESKEEESKNEFLKASLHHQRIKHIKNRVNDGYFINDLEANLVGLLRI